MAPLQFRLLPKTPHILEVKETLESFFKTKIRYVYHDLRKLTSSDVLKAPTETPLCNRIETLSSVVWVESYYLPKVGIPGLHGNPRCERWYNVAASQEWSPHGLAVENIFAGMEPAVKVPPSRMFGFPTPKGRVLYHYGQVRYFETKPLTSYAVVLPNKPSSRILLKCRWRQEVLASGAQLFPNKTRSV